VSLWPLAEKGSARGGCREVRVRPSPPTLGSRAALEACWRGDAMTASAVFILDVKGKVVISRNYRGDVPMNCVERFAGVARARGLMSPHARIGWPPVGLCLDPSDR